MGHRQGSISPQLPHKLALTSNILHGTTIHNTKVAGAKANNLDPTKHAHCKEAIVMASEEHELVGMRKMYKSIKVTERGGISISPWEVFRSKSFQDYCREQGYKTITFQGQKIKLTD